MNEIENKFKKKKNEIIEKYKRTDIGKIGLQLFDERVLPTADRLELPLRHMNAAASWRKNAEAYVHHVSDRRVLPGALGMNRHDHNHTEAFLLSDSLRARASKCGSVENRKQSGTFRRRLRIAAAMRLCTFSPASDDMKNWFSASVNTRSRLLTFAIL